MPRSNSSNTERDYHAPDRWFSFLVQAPAIALVLILALIGLYLFKGSWPALSKFGVGFFFREHWDPVKENFGAASMIFGTLASSLIAVLIAAPLSIGIALFLNELAPKKVSGIVGFLVEMLAAIPSVVFGLWGIFVMAPFLRETVQPALGKYLGFLPFFEGPPFGVGMMSAAIILAIMITPTISSICREVFRAVPDNLREAALGIGATRWEMMRLAVFAASKSGVMGAIILGLGRALGETMAVTMLIGNRPEISWSLFAPGQTMASAIANEYAEASSSAHLSALMAVGFALFLVTFIVNALARVTVWHSTRKLRS